MNRAHIRNKAGLCSLALALCCTGVCLSCALAKQDQNTALVAPYAVAKDNADRQAKEWREYGIGWFVHKSHSGKLTYEHSGGSIGGTSQLILYPESHIVVALVTNLSGGIWKREEVEAVAEKFAWSQK